MGSVDLILFGITGDLARNKIIPALFSIYLSKKAEGVSHDKQIRLIGYGRREMGGEEFEKYILDSISSTIATRSKGYSKFDLTSAVVEFLNNCRYVKGEIDSGAGYLKLKKMLSKDSEKIFFLSLPPDLQPVVAEMLHKNKVAGKGSKILLEKPFGMDVLSAKKFDTGLSAKFGDDALYRIDHYLGKEGLLSLYDARFVSKIANTFWCGKYISSIDVVLHEKKTAEGRGALYEKLGVTRDVIQNHLSQIVAMIIMRAPVGNADDAAAVQRARATAISSLSVTPKSIKYAQYEGYLNEAGVAAHSPIETAISFEARSSFPEWNGTRINVSAGKGMATSETSITINYKDKKTKPLVIPLSFTVHSMSNLERPKDAYQILIERAAIGDKRVFTSLDEVLAGWKLVEKIHKEIKASKVRLLKYKIGKGI